MWQLLQMVTHLQIPICQLAAGVFSFTYVLCTARLSFVLYLQLAWQAFRPLKIALEACWEAVLVRETHSAPHGVNIMSYGQLVLVMPPERAMLLHNLNTALSG